VRKARSNAQNKRIENMNKILVSLLVVFLLTACGEKSEQENLKDGLLNKEEFANLMMDVQLVEGHLNTNRVNQVFVTDSANHYYKEIFEKHGITLQLYKENMKYYVARPKMLESIYIEVEKQLLAQEKQYENVLIDVPAISPINRPTLTKIIKEDTLAFKLIYDSTLSYVEIKDSIFSLFNDSILKVYNTNELSFQQSFNVSTHSKPMFRLFKGQLKSVKK